MGSPQPSTSHTTDPLLFKDESGKLEGYGKETYTLLKYVFHEMKEEAKETDIEESPLETAQRYTGLPINILETLISKNVSIDKITEINRKCIHEALMSFYLEKHVMPTATELFQSLQDSLQCYEDIRSFRKKLVQMGYIFKKKADSFVVYEKPSIRFERFLYLKHIVKYRQDKIPIYFVTEISTSYKMVWNEECKPGKNKRSYYNYFALTSLKGVECLRKVEDFNKHFFHEWILGDVIPFLETNGVVVLYNSEHYCDKFLETPQKTSPSYIMTEWLAHYEIPFTDNMSTVELYTLIEKYTDLHANLNKADLWLKQSGHHVLRLPNCIHELTLASHVCKVINKNFIQDIRIDIGETALNSYNLMLVNEETRLYNMEIQLDNILDTLQPSSFIEKDLYLPYLSDSE